MSEVEIVDPVVSETVVSESESEGEEVSEIMNNEGPVETESTSEVTVEPAIEEEEPEAEEEPSPAETTEPEEPAPTEPVSTQEVVQNVQEILSSTETNVSGNDLENRVKVLEERLEKLIQILKDIHIDRRKCVKQINEL